MDGEMIQHLTAEEAARYKDLEAVFGLPGWAAIEAYFKKEADDAVIRGALANTWEANRVELGVRLACLKVATLRDATEREFIDRAEANKEAKEDKEAEQFE